MTAAPTLLVGAFIYYVLHHEFGVPYVPTTLIGLAFAAVSGYVAGRRFGP